MRRLSALVFLLTRALRVGLPALTLSIAIVACGGGGGDNTVEEASDPVAEAERAQALGLYDRLPVSWSPTSLDFSLERGARKDVQVTLTSKVALRRARIVFVPDLRNVVSVSPETISSLDAGQSTTVTLSFAPQATDTRRFIAGVVFLYDRNANISRPLLVKVSLKEPEAVSQYAILPAATIAGPPKLFVVELLNVRKTSQPTAVRYTFQAKLRNEDRPLSNVYVRLDSVSAPAQIIVGRALVGRATGSSDVVSSDSLAVELPANVQFDPSSWKWSVTANAPGALGELDRSASVLGTDANANGVRDDVEAVVAELQLEANSARALLQVAKSLQGMLSVTDPPQARQAAVAFARAMRCLSDRTDDLAPLSKRVQVATINTEPRFRAYIAFERHLDPATLPDDPPTPVCD